MVKYDKLARYGPETSFFIANVSKIFLGKPMKENHFEAKSEQGLLPANCQFLVLKKTNPEVWVTFSVSHFAFDDCKLQEHQWATLSLKAASDLLKSLSKTVSKDQIEIEKPLAFLNDSLSHAVKLNPQSWTKCLEQNREIQ